MPNFILHHYPLSPFSEKIRIMLGYAGLNWQSCITREMPPRPLLARLAGGYRKIPVAQIGADIFCDTHLIASEIATLANKPELIVANLDATQQAYIAKTDLDVFFACLFVSGTKQLNMKVLKAMSLLDVGRFIYDRINIGRKSRVRSVNPLKAKEQVRAHLADLEQRLTQDFLFGGTPTHADFSTYHSLWFVHDLAESPLMHGHSRVLDWMTRMKAFGHGASQQISEAQALNAAKSEPRAIPEAYCQDAMIGQTVSIAPADYGCEPTVGVLVGVAPDRWILSRQDGEVGTLHVHFPRMSYTLKQV